VENDTSLVNDDKMTDREGVQHGTKITFDPSTDHHPRREQQDSTLYIPGPRARDQGTYPQPLLHSTDISRATIRRA
jgi:hypothetical protein